MSEPSRDRDDVLVRFVVGNRCESGFQAGACLLSASGRQLDLREAAGDGCRSVGVAWGEQLVGRRKESFGGHQFGVLKRHPRCTVEKSRPLERILASAAACSK